MVAAALPVAPRFITGGPGSHGSTYHGRAAECLQQFAYAYPHESGLIDPTTGTYEVRERGSDLTRALALGILVHVYMAHYYADMGARQPGGFTFRGEHVQGENQFMLPAKAVKQEADNIGRNVLKELAYSNEDLVEKAILAGRIHRREFQFEKIKVLAVEEPGEGWIRSEVTGNRYKYNPRLDLEFELNKRAWLLDFKTTSSPKGNPEQQWALDLQFLGMHKLGRKKYGDRFAGVLVNQIEFVGDDVNVYRVQPEYSPSALEDWAMSLAFRQDQIQALKARKVPGDRWPKALKQTICIGKYGKCPFYERCRGSR